jgi:hypothetical protein
MASEVDAVGDGTLHGFIFVGQLDELSLSLLNFFEPLLLLSFLALLLPKNRRRGK